MIAPPNVPHRLLAVLAVLALLGAACSGDDTVTTASGAGDEASTDADTDADTDTDGEEGGTSDGGTADGGDETAATLTVETDGTSSSGPGSGTGTDGGTTDAGSTGSVGSYSGDPDSEWCQEVRAAAEVQSNPLDLDLIGLSAEELSERVTEAELALRTWQDAAPPEIENAVTVLAGSFTTFAEFGAEYEWDLMSMASEPEFVTVFDPASLQVAADEIAAYNRDVCGVDLSTVDGAVAPPPSTDTERVAVYLDRLGITSSVLDDEQLACIVDELTGTYPDGLPAVDDASGEAVAAVGAALTACTRG